MKWHIGRTEIFNGLAVAAVTFGLCCSSNDRAAGQNVIGTNASPCAGNCAPGTPYGFFKPHWRQWPGVIYPDTMIQKPVSEEISPPNVQLPGKEIESSIQAQPTPAQQRSGGNATEAVPTPNDTTPDMEGATPQIKPLDESSGAGARGMMPQRSVPPADQNPFGPAPDSEPDKTTPPPSSGSSFSPAMRMRMATSNSDSNIVNNHVNSASGRAQWTSTDAKNSPSWKSTRFKTSTVDLARYSQVEDDAEMTIPTLRTKAPEPTNQDLAAISGPNPLRTESSTPRAARTATVQPAVSYSSDRSVIDSNTTNDADWNSGPRANPLRRN
jgi:hypothetical protein